MTSADLKKYCSKDDDRPTIMFPWSAGEYTYASNGHIMVRVPRLADVPENPKAAKTLMPKSKQERPIDDFFTDEPKAWYPIPEKQPEMFNCDVCGGGGRIPLNGKVVPCIECDGSGQRFSHLSIEIGGIPFSDLYLSWIAELPGGKIGPMGEEVPARFRFHGRFHSGEGLLMPKRKW